MDRHDGPVERELAQLVGDQARPLEQFLLAFAHLRTGFVEQLRAGERVLDDRQPPAVAGGVAGRAAARRAARELGGLGAAVAQPAEQALGEDRAHRRGEQVRLDPHVEQRSFERRRDDGSDPFDAERGERPRDDQPAGDDRLAGVGDAGGELTDPRCIDFTFA